MAISLEPNSAEGKENKPKRSSGVEIFLEDRPLESAKKVLGIPMDSVLPFMWFKKFFVPIWPAKVLAAALLDSRSRGYKRLLVGITSPSDKPPMLGFSTTRASGGTMAICDWSIVSRETKAVISLVIEAMGNCLDLFFSRIISPV